VQISFEDFIEEPKLYWGVTLPVGFLAVAGVVFGFGALISPSQELRCQSAASGAAEVVNRAPTESAIISMARNSNEQPAPSAYRPDSSVDQAIARVRRECFGQQPSR
jgi:hypothetical protein